MSNVEKLGQLLTSQRLPAITNALHYNCRVIKSNGLIFRLLALQHHQVEKIYGFSVSHGDYKSESNSDAFHQHTIDDTRTPVHILSVPHSH